VPERGGNASNVAPLLIACTSELEDLTEGVTQPLVAADPALLTVQFREQSWSWW
jgi:hypothetical protein